MSGTLSASYDYCTRLARRSASSFILSFWMLPRAKRRAMSALYAFLRTADDIGDGPGLLPDRERDLAAFRAELESALQGQSSGPLFPALADTVRRFEIPPEFLFAALDGVEMDLRCREYRTFADLADYCHHVASVVGFACLHIWGFSDERAFIPGEKCGLAFQLTNILRDLAEDAARGRCYLPQEELERFGYSWDELRRGEMNESFRALMRFQVERAEEFYREARELERFLDRDGRGVLGVMFETYHALLAEIRARDGDVFTSRVRLPRHKKWGLAAKWLFLRPARIPFSVRSSAVVESVP